MNTGLFGRLRIFVCLTIFSALFAQAQSPVALTIYNENFFVARERLPMDLKAGVNHIDYVGVAAQLEPDSVILRDSSGHTLQIIEQSYRNDPVSQERLLNFYEGKTIGFSVRNADGSTSIVSGKIVRAGYAPRSQVVYPYAPAYQTNQTAPAAGGGQ